MRTHTCPHRFGFSIAELTLVIVILGILSTILAPQLFGSADEANHVNVQMQLRNARTQLELYRLKTEGRDPQLVDRQWNEMIKLGLLNTAPQNVYQQGSTIIGDEAAPGVGWVWDGTTLFAVAADGSTLVE